MIRTDPAPNTIVRRGSAITVFVSQGPGKTTVPALIGLTDSQALELLRNAELTWDVLTRNLDDPDDPNGGLVVEQSVTAGEEIDKGTEVVFVIGIAPEPTTTTSTTTTTTVAPSTTAAAPPTTAAAPATTASATTTP